MSMRDEETVTQIKTYLLSLQDNLTHQLSKEENVTFKEDNWRRKEGGGGKTRIMEAGETIERAGVNFSHVKGGQLPATASAQRPYLAVPHSFEALGVSSVIHPFNPYVPSCHLNLRFIQVETSEKEIYWWFGGGFDLTPYYGFEEDCVHWHRMAKKACAPFGLDVYPRYKKWCDDYFFLPHRNEPRGIGGLFFDDLNEWKFDLCFAFMQSVGTHFIEAYFPIFHRRKNAIFSEKEKNFQLYRRGRYVEFNLLYDRGTVFGIQSGGRTESILMSLPPLVKWEYEWSPFPGSPEDQLYQQFLIKREWPL